MSVSKVISQLQKKLIMNNSKQVFQPHEIEEMFGPGFVQQYADKPEDHYIDVPDTIDTKYTTHRPFVLPRGKKAGSNYLPLESKIQEQDDDVKSETPPKSDPNVAEEPTGDVGVGRTRGMDVGGIRGMGGIMGQEEEEQKDAGELGRIYELKKIYSRLTSIESYLSSESSAELSAIRNYVSNSIELFEIVSSNFDSYKDKLNDIIIMYYKFIREVYNTVRDYYKKR